MKEGVDKSGPSFVRPMGDMAVDEGLKLRITTPVKGNPIPEFKWTKDGKPITHDRVHAFSDGDLVSFSYQFCKKIKIIFRQYFYFSIYPILLNLTQIYSCFF